MSLRSKVLKSKRLQGAQPRIEEDSYAIFCGPYGFYFGPDVQDGDYRLQEFSADGED